MIRARSMAAFTCVVLAMIGCSLKVPGSGGPSSVIIYAATSAGVDASDTGGSSWSSQGLVTYAVNEVVAVPSGAFVTEYAATSNGIYVSTDGSTWPTSWLSGRVVNGIFVSGTDIYAATNAGLFISLDGGTTWPSSPNPADSMTSVYVSGSGATAVIFVSAAAGTNGLYISPDGGTTWSTYGTGSATLPTNNVYSVFYDGTNVLIGTDQGLYETPYASLPTWSTLYNDTVSGFSASNTVKDVVTSGSTVYASTSAGLSVFNGATWTTYLSGLTVNSVSVSGTTVYASTTTGVWISSNAGATWTQDLSGADVNASTVD